MTILLISLAVLAVVTLAISYFSKNKNDNDDTIVIADDCSTCTGQNEKCEQECMMEAATKDIEYYDDEELDTFKGRDSDSYSDNEAEQFREILYTMREDEVKGWNRSLHLRGIAVPDQIKDEMFMLIDN